MHTQRPTVSSGQRGQNLKIWKVLIMNSLENANVGIPKENRLIDGRAVQARILSEVREYVTQASAKFPIGRLVSISIGDHPESGACG